MYKRILVAIDLNDATAWRAPLRAAAEHARKFGAELIVLTVVREVDAILQATGAPISYEMVAGALENELRKHVREVEAEDLNPQIVVTHGVSIYAQILGVADEAGVDLVVVGSHRPEMKDYLLGTNAGRVVRHANCSVLVCRGRE